MLNKQIYQEGMSVKTLAENDTPFKIGTVLIIQGFSINHYLLLGKETRWVNPKLDCWEFDECDIEIYYNV